MIEIRYWKVVLKWSDETKFRGMESLESNLLEEEIYNFPSDFVHLRPRLTLRRRNFKTQQSPAILDLCLRKTRSGKLHAVIIVAPS